MLRRLATLVLCISVVGLVVVVSLADETSKAAKSEASAKSNPSKTSRPTPEQEQAFAELLTGAVLEGTWRMTTFEEGKVPDLGEPRADKYTIEKAQKVLDDSWIITARVQYADKDVSLPFPVRVIWADDTPMITLDTMNLPMLGVYSARVIFHKGFYSGVWYGASYGGVMSGKVIANPEGPATSQSKP